MFKLHLFITLTRLNLEKLNELKSCIYNEDLRTIHRDNYIMKSGSTVHDAPQSLVIHLIQFVHLGNKLHVYMYRKVFKTDQLLVDNVRHSNYYIVQSQTFREKKKTEEFIGTLFLIVCCCQPVPIGYIYLKNLT